ncbi:MULTISPECIES: DUF6417 family protein [Streptomyces]|uniref:DUF6417 family protein n=2 Tax=Streptomyces TaxID=1883 RepID=A0ABV9J4F9_9ACTN
MERILDALQTVRACEERSEHGWVLDTVVEPLRPSVRMLAREGLVEGASRETRAELSAWEGRPVRSAVRVSSAGRDLLAYAQTRPDPAPSGPGPGERLVELLPSQMAALRVFVGLAGELASPPAPGLAERVRTAVHDRGAGRWRLHLTQEQMESVAYGFWLHQMTGSAGEANRFGRAYGVLHQPETAANAAAAAEPRSPCPASPGR